MNDNEKSIQMDDIMTILRSLERRISRLESSLTAHKVMCNVMSDNVYSMYKKIGELKSKIDDVTITAGTAKIANLSNAKYTRSKFADMESDIGHLFHLMHGCNNFCGNCKHCKLFPDGLYKCDITECETDPDDSSCIRFESPQTPKSDAEVCLNCSDKDTTRCLKCSHFPF